jgi:hypothetical protein
VTKLGQFPPVMGGSGPTFDLAGAPARRVQGE